MDEKEKPARVVVTEAWRKEQQAKRAAYEAKRRAWVRTFESGTTAGDDESPGPDGSAADVASEPDAAAVPARRGRRGGTIQDRRQARFTF